MAALCPIVRCNLAVVDGSYAAVRRVSALRSGSGACVFCALTIARCPIPCSSVAISGRVVTRFCLSVP
jgi:hypothetical protein